MRAVLKNKPQGSLDIVGSVLKGEVAKFGSRPNVYNQIYFHGYVAFGESLFSYSGADFLLRL